MREPGDNLPSVPMRGGAAWGTPFWFVLHPVDGFVRLYNLFGLTTMAVVALGLVLLAWIGWRAWKR